MILLKRLDKRGITLVELMIAMAMMAIVSLILSLFMYSGSKSYHYAKTNTDVQKESQLLIAQIRDMALQSNCYKYDDTHKALVLYNLKAPTPTLAPTGTPSPIATPVPTAAVATVTGKKVIYYNAANQKLYYQSITGNATPSYSTDESNLMGDYVTGFKVSINDAGDTINVTLTMKEGQYSYTVKQKIHMRNDRVDLP